jgi:ABC-type multidrug transport system ATPase subunit
MIEAQGLTKRYGRYVAVDGLSLEVRPGEIYGFLGPNGAGKTTTIMMILGLVPPDAGVVRLFGQDSRTSPLALRSRIGVMAESQGLYLDLTVKEYLGLFADFYRVRDRAKRIDEVLSRVGLSEVRNRLTGALSRGMRQKLGMARVLLHDPDLLILDEPVSSLDPYGIKEIRDIILEENSKGKSLLISSHILSEIERTCHRVGIISGGKLVAQDTMAGLKRSLTSEAELELELEEMPADLLGEILERIRSMPFVLSVDTKDYIMRVRVSADQDHRGEISRTITGSGGVILRFLMHEISLEEAFVTITESNVHDLTKGVGRE